MVSCQEFVVGIDEVGEFFCGGEFAVVLGEGAEADGVGAALDVGAVPGDQLCKLADWGSRLRPNGAEPAKVSLTWSQRAVRAGAGASLRAGLG